MSLANTCDRCKSVIDGKAVTDKDDFDIAILVDGEPYYECEDICPKCRADFIEMVNMFKRNVPPVELFVRAVKPVDEPAPSQEPPAETKKEPDEPAPIVEQGESNTVAPYRSLTGSDLPNAVTKRFPIPATSNRGKAC